MTGEQAVWDAAGTCAQILDALETVIVGKRQPLELVLSGLLARGHVLLEDLPGLGKTLIARSLAQVTGLTVGRIQFTPDLMPADVTGSLLYDQRQQTFEFRQGPVFNNIVLGDEINRAPPKTQAALLEAMQERQVTVDGVSHRLPDPFVVVATRTRSSSKGPTPSPRPRSTGSCSGRRSGTRAPTKRRRSCAAGSGAVPTTSSFARSWTLRRSTPCKQPSKW